METSKSQLTANAGHREKAIDRVVVEVKRGKKEEYKQAAVERNIELMELFRRGADEYIMNHPADKTEDG